MGDLAHTRDSPQEISRNSRSLFPLCFFYGTCSCENITNLCDPCEVMCLLVQCAVRSSLAGALLLHPSTLLQPLQGQGCNGCSCVVTPPVDPLGCCPCLTQISWLTCKEWTLQKSLPEKNLRDESQQLCLLMTLSVVITQSKVLGLCAPVQIHLLSHTWLVIV